jgi:hypothetical protein
MTRKDVTTTEIVAGGTDAECLLSLTSTDAADAKRVFPTFRLTHLVTVRFDMDAVEAADFLNLCGAAPTPAPQNVDAAFHVHLRRVIDRSRLDCPFVEDAPGPYHHTIRPRGYDYSVDAGISQGHGNVARRLSKHAFRTADVRSLNNLALPRREGSHLAAAGTLHLACDRGAPYTTRNWCPIGLGSSDFPISGLVDY